MVGQRWGAGAAGNRALRRLVQVVFQDPFSSLSPRMTVEEIVGEGLTVHEPEPGRCSSGASACSQALADVGLGEAQFPGLLRPLSARVLRRPAPAPRHRAGADRRSPQLLVLDEPTSALDVTIQKQVLGLLQRLQRETGLSYLLITHDVDVIRAMAHRRAW